MAGKAKAVAAEPKTISRTGPKEYYVLDQRVGSELAGVKVTTRDNDRVVVMSPAQAQYFVDQGTIGEKPLSKMSATEQEAIKQMHRSAAP